MTEASQIPIRSIRTPEARAYADALTIAADLEFVASALEKLLGMVRADDSDQIVARSLWSTALVTYSRCFAGGNRLGLKEEDVGSLGPGRADFHRWLKGLRDKHIAHPVNAFEQIAVGVALSPQDGPPGEVIGIGHLYFFHVTPDEAGIVEALRFVTNLKSGLAARVNRLEAETLAAAKALPIRTLYRRPTLRLTAPHPDSASQSRPRTSD